MSHGFCFNKSFLYEKVHVIRYCFQKQLTRYMYLLYPGVVNLAHDDSLRWPIVISSVDFLWFLCPSNILPVYHSVNFLCPFHEMVLGIYMCLRLRPYFSDSVCTAIHQSNKKPGICVLLDTVMSVF